MGNSQTKEARPGSSRGHTRQLSGRNPSSPTASGPAGPSHERTGSGVYTARTGRGSRHDLSFLGIGAVANPERDPALEPRRETKAEREARKLEKERAQRELDRERSIREEGVDGGFLVTLGTYTGPEDYSKPVVRQLQIERRMAPFWKGLNDHSDTWVEHQLVAIVNGLPLPPADEIPPEEPPRPNKLGADWNPRSSNSNINHLTVPISSRSMSQNSERSMNLSPSHPAFSLPSPTSPIAASPSSSPFFRGRAKTLAALTTGSRNSSQTEMIPQEIELPKDPYVNGQRIEAFLYKNASECPICFLYYPPYLNKTRCCDQPICSECFVQIKRPDPHPPEHHDPSNPTVPPEPQEDGALVSEPAACPFCVQPEFGVTYEPPPFRRGLSYANQGHHSLANAASAMSSTSSLNSQGLTSPGRRRATSLAANDNTVITTDRVRPDWAKKLADARSHALRRAAAATALHNAAYMMGNLPADSRGFGLGRRRRTMFGNDSAGSSGHGTPRRDGDVGALLAAAVTGGSSSRNEVQNDLLPGRHSSRRGNRLEDLEELMMMEAIRLSLAAEEDRKKKEEKEAAKESKKEEKKKAKDAKRSERTLRRIGIQSGFHPAPNMDGDDELYPASSSNAAGKGKAVDRSGGFASFDPLNEPTSTINGSSSKDDPQKHLEQSRAHIQRGASNISESPPSDPFADQPSHRSALRNLSNASSSASSFAESLQGSLRRDGHGGFGASASSFEPSPNESGLSLDRDETSPQGTPGSEPMFNFRSLAAVITTEDGKKEDSSPLHIENVTDEERRTSGSSRHSQDHETEDIFKHSPPDIAVQPPGYCQASEPKQSEPIETLGESVMTLRPSTAAIEDEDEIAPAPRVEAISSMHSSHLDSKHIQDVNMVDSREHQHTQ
ncbi:hypothetical protein K505DRAFT_406672 [Melanomma pulvis-pyrius CBS 109.77]|uniref:Protein sip5 n=1 Tax=Melanomma pulvis-pyrius CBS 109.77 TaxID=1314802 RepID=A0A6A6XHI0_9PLEO|nr:hypothetical protein K505DRAFT_406672 [Melanomma pulvis-pyrius CBS 109.77]